MRKIRYFSRALPVLLLLWAGMLSAHAGDVSEVEALKQAQQWIAQKNNTQAEAVLSPFRESGTLAQTYALLGDLYRRRMAYQAACDMLQKAYALQEKATKPDLFLSLDYLVRLEESHRALGEYQQTGDDFALEKTLYAKLKEAFVLDEKTLKGVSSVETPVVFMEIARLESDPEKKRDLLRQGLQYADDASGWKPLFYLELGHEARAKADLVQAEAEYNNALASLEKAVDILPAARASVVSHIGSFYFSKGDLEKATRLFSEATHGNRLDAPAMYSSFMLSRIRQIQKKDPAATYLTPEYRKQAFAFNPKSKAIWVYFEPGHPEYEKLALRALETWNHELPQPFVFQVSSNPRKYDIHVIWGEKARREPCSNTSELPWWTGECSVEPAGENITAFEHHNEIFKNEIEIYLQDFEGRPRGEADIFGILLHESGHAMGLRMHSDFQGDVMYKAGSSGMFKKTLSARDIASIRELYNLKPVFTNPLNRRLSDVLRTVKEFDSAATIRFNR